MATETVIWTAVPNGVSETGKFRLSLHVSPRLVPNGAAGQLSDFPDFATWPNTAISRYLVQFGNGSSVLATDVTSPAASAARWSALFAPSTLVRGRSFEDFTKRRIRSYPVGNVIRHLRDRYTDIARNFPEDFPDLQALGPFVYPLLPDNLQSGLAQVESRNGPPNYVLQPAAPNPTLDFAQLERFHTPPATVVPGPQGAPQVPTFDFHDMCSLAQDHPTLLRLLRLVIDLELQEAPPASGITTVRVFPRAALTFTGVVSVSPLTQCEIAMSPPTFRAVPSAVNVELGDGYLRVEDPHVFGVAPVDQDGGALKAINFAAVIDSSNAHRSVDTPDSFAVPSLRATGLAVFRTGRAPALRSGRLQRGLSLDANLTTGVQPGDNVLFYAEDLVQGARFDAMDSAIGKWRSLTARSGTYRFTATNAVETVAYDEAASNDAPTTAHDGSSDDLYLGETIVTWNGWSLGAPRPSLFLTEDANLQPHKSEAQPSGLPLEISYGVVKGSLPRLRFGSSYRLRARAVDIAGNSLPLSDSSASHASAPVLFGRLDPVQSPAVLLRRPRAPGDAVDRLVLRSNYNTVPAPATTERHMAAPKVSQRTAELHGMFDTAGPPSVLDTNAYAMITARESKMFTDLGSAQADPGGNDVHYFDVDDITVPYLPDPVARGALLRGLDPGSNAAFPVVFDGAWPALDGVRMVLRERGVNDPPFFYHPPNRRLDVFLAKAEKRTVRLSSVPDFNLILQFLLWRWIVDAGGATPQLQAAVVEGRHWMFTPYRELTLVHAVKQPLATVDFQELRVLRNPAETFATLVGRASFSRRSTARVDLEARWFEYVDGGPGSALPSRPDPNNPNAWLDRPERTAIAISTAVGETPSNQQKPDELNLFEAPAPGPRHSFGDTKRRDVGYLTRAYSRFDEFFRRSGPVDFGKGSPQQLDAAGVVAGSVRLSSIVNTSDGPRTVPYTEGRDFTVDPPTGDVRREGSAMPLKVDASWVPRPNDRLAAQAVNVIVPSSARPEAPRVLYAVPTFSFTSSSGLGSRTRTRKGGGLRVYVERPWWSSGGGELLGVLIANNSAGQSPLPADAALVATQWGVDPVHAGAATPDAPDPTRFPLRVSTSYNVVAAEQPNVSLAVAGHMVGFDAERDLWFCDIEIDAGSAWMPFVRLALARWQPESVGSLALSPVVLADFIQLAADRTATVVAGNQPSQFSVQLAGPSYNTSTADAAGPRARVTVQVRNQDVPGPLGWDSVSSVELGRKFLAGPSVVYAGTVGITQSMRANGARLLFEEFEQVRTDGLKSSNPAYGSRVVYADTVELA